MSKSKTNHHFVTLRGRVAFQAVDMCADRRVSDIIENTPDKLAEKAERMRRLHKMIRAQHRAMTRKRTPEEIERSQAKRKIARERTAALPDFKDGE